MGLRRGFRVIGLLFDWITVRLDYCAIGPQCCQASTIAHVITTVFRDCYCVSLYHYLLQASTTATRGYCT